MTKPTECTDPFTLVADALQRPRGAITIESEMYREPGWDSFGHIMVISALEKAYGIVVEDAEVERYTRMRAIVELYERVRGGEHA